MVIPLSEFDKYPIKGEYFDWKIQDVPASELLRYYNTGNQFHDRLRKYISDNRMALQQEMELKLYTSIKIVASELNDN